MKWLPLSLEPQPSRPPVSKGSHRDRHRDRIDRGGERGDRIGDGGTHRDHKEGHIHKERDGYREHFRGDRGYHYYNKYGGHDRDRGDGSKEQDRQYRKDRHNNLPPRYTNQPQGTELTGTDSGNINSGGNYNMYEGNNRGYGGRGRGGRGRHWRYASPSSGQGKTFEREKGIFFDFSLYRSG